MPRNVWWLHWYQTLPIPLIACCSHVLHVQVGKVNKPFSGSQNTLQHSLKYLGEYCCTLYSILSTCQEICKVFAGSDIGTLFRTFVSLIVSHPVISPHILSSTLFWLLYHYSCQFYLLKPFTGVNAETIGLYAIVFKPGTCRPVAGAHLVS